MTDEDFKRGDKAEWDSSGGHSVGTVVKKLTKATKIKQHRVAATAERLQYLLRSDKSGSEAAHKPDGLKNQKYQGALILTHEDCHFPFAGKEQAKPRCGSSW